MKRLMIATIAALLVVGTLPAVAQRWVDRASTDPGNDLDRVSFAGEISSITGQIAYVKTDGGEEFAVHLGPRWYWHERGYRLRTGIHVEVSGWRDSDDGSSCFAGYISGDGFHYELSDSDGYPLWAQYGERGNDWRPRRDVVVHHYWAPPPRAPRWWHRPRHVYWNNHWGHHYRPHYYHQPRHGGCYNDGPRYRNDPPPRQRGGRRGY